MKTVVESILLVLRIPQKFYENFINHSSSPLRNFFASFQLQHSRNVCPIFFRLFALISDTNRKRNFCMNSRPGVFRPNRNFRNTHSMDLFFDQKTCHTVLLSYLNLIYTTGGQLSEDTWSSLEKTERERKTMVLNQRQIFTKLHVQVLTLIFFIYRFRTSYSTEICSSFVIRVYRVIA